MATEQIADINETIEGSGKDRPLRDDIRLLGRILGDTVREQEGEAVFDIVERIRQTSIRFHRDNDEAARHSLETILNNLSPGQTVQIVRAFSYFSHLANIAEDQHHIRRTRAHTLAGAAPRAGTIAHAIDRAQDAGIGAAELGVFFDEALVSPVLTAHPTEVRRKSTLDREMEIADLLDYGQVPFSEQPPPPTPSTPNHPPPPPLATPPPARTRPTYPRGDGSQQRTAAASRTDPVADKHAAPEQAHGARRSGERPVLLRLHVLTGGPASIQRIAGRSPGR